MLVYLEMLETPEEKLKFEQLYFLYRDKMYAVAFKILHNENDAEDIVHESFKTIIENFEKINDISCHKTWNYIVTIVKNKSFTLYQKKKHHETSSYEDWTEVEMNFTPEEVTEKREVAEILAELISAYPFLIRKFYTCNTTMHFPVRKSLNLSIKHLPTFAKSPSGQRQC